MYDGEDKRFTSVDPLKGTLVNAASLGRYVYVLNNPLRYTDPLGLIGSAQVPMQDGGDNSALAATYINLYNQQFQQYNAFLMWQEANYIGDESKTVYFAKMTCEQLSSFFFGMVSALAANAGMAVVHEMFDQLDRLDFLNIFSKQINRMRADAHNDITGFQKTLAGWSTQPESYYIGQMTGDVLSLLVALGEAKMAANLIISAGTSTMTGGALAFATGGVAGGGAVLVAAAQLALSTVLIGAAAGTVANATMNFSQHSSNFSASIRFVKVPFQGKQVPVYRGGSDFTVEQIDVRFDENGFVTSDRGISLNVDTKKAAIHGKPHRIDALPDGLGIKHRGNDIGHYEIVPTRPMKLNEYQKLLNQVKTTPLDQIPQW